MDNEIKKTKNFFTTFHSEILMPYVEKMNEKFAESGKTISLYSSETNVREELKTPAKIYEHLVIKPTGEEHGTSGSVLGKPYLLIQCNAIVGEVKIIHSGSTMTSFSIQDLNKEALEPFLDKFIKEEFDK